MKRRPEFLGGYIRRQSWLHRIPTLALLACVCAMSIAVMIFRSPLGNGALGAVVLGCGLSAGLPIRSLLAPLSRVWVLLAALVAVQLLFKGWYVGLQAASTIAVCLVAGGIVMLTNTIAELLRAFEILAKPLALIGVDPGQVALAAALTVRSIPYLMDLFAQAGRSAAARGLQRNIRARTTPVFIRAVQYALDTGRALDARGILEQPADGPTRSLD